jgi:hypothetical protein
MVNIIMEFVIVLIFIFIMKILAYMIVLVKMKNAKINDMQLNVMKENNILILWMIIKKMN